MLETPIAKLFVNLDHFPQTLGGTLKQNIFELPPPRYDQGLLTVGIPPKKGLLTIGIPRF